MRRYLPGGWSSELVPVHTFLLEHPDGLCLFDAGQTAEAGRAGYLPRWHPFLRLSRFELTQAEEVAAQLQRMGFRVEDVRWVVLSHLHTDHAGGLTPFRSAQVLVASSEWALATGLRGRLRGYLPQHWPREIEPSLVDFESGPVGPFPASEDLAGDGTLILVPTPGHTAGHMSLLARGEDGGHLCCGDLVHHARELPEVAPDIDRFCRENKIVPLATHDPAAPAAVARAMAG